MIFHKAYFFQWIFATSLVAVSKTPFSRPLNYKLRYAGGLRHYRINSQSQDTIFALSTAQGKAGIAIIRISGPNAYQVFFCIYVFDYFKELMV